MDRQIQNNGRINYILKAFLFCIVFTGLFIAFSFAKNFFPEKQERLVHGIIGSIAAFLTTFLFLKPDKKSFADIGLLLNKNTLTKFFKGVLAGTGLMGLLVLSVIYFSGFNIELNANSDILNLFIFTLPLIPLAFMEELAFRAYPLYILKDRTGARYAIIITSVLFALYHIVNGWTIQNAFLGAGSWGILYGLAAVYSNGIAMPTGMHYAANLVTAAFGVSGNSFNPWILKYKDGSNPENYQTGQLVILIPQLIILLTGIICVEWYLRKNTRD